MKFLIIQNAFIGDVILATAAVEKLHAHYPDSQIDFMLRSGTESLLRNHPFINETYILDKSRKYSSLWDILKRVRAMNYDYVINLHRFGSSGFITAFSGAKHRIGFSKNGFSFLFTRKFKHLIGDGTHEVERNNLLIAHLTDEHRNKPKLYPSANDYEAVKSYQHPTGSTAALNYVCIAPTSVWFTKQFPKEKWAELIDKVRTDLQVYLLGGQQDLNSCEEIKKMVRHPGVINLAGKLTLLQTAALMEHAEMNYVNDSAPMHLASAMNAPVKAVFCSTIPAFGFGPLSEHSRIIETKEKLDCRPCGLHGHRQCPKGHFRCAYSIDINELLS